MSRCVTAFALFAAASLVVTQVHARTLTSPDEVKGAAVFVNFDELRTKDKAVFGSSTLGQPYSQLGLILPSQMVDVNANMGPSLTVGVVSTGVSTADNSTYQSIAFTKPQRLAAFTVRSPKAKTIHVAAYDNEGRLLDQTFLDGTPEAQFVGFNFDSPKITVIRVVAPHSSMADALDAPTQISGITFSSRSEDQTGDSIDSVLGGSDLGLASASGIGGTGGGGAFASVNGGGSFGGGGGGGAGSGSGIGAVGARNPNLPPAIIPEPTSFALLGGPAVVLLGMRRRRTIA